MDAKGYQGTLLYLDSTRVLAKQAQPASRPAPRSNSNETSCTGARAPSSQNACPWPSLPPWGRRHPRPRPNHPLSKIAGAVRLSTTGDDWPTTTMPDRRCADRAWRCECASEADSGLLRDWATNAGCSTEYGVSLAKREGGGGERQAGVSLSLPNLPVRKSPLEVITSVLPCKINRVVTPSIPASDAVPTGRLPRQHPPPSQQIPGSGMIGQEALIRIKSIGCASRRRETPISTRPARW